MRAWAAALSTTSAALSLGAITALTQLAVYGALAFASSQSSGWFLAHPRAATATARGMGALLIVTALLSAAQAWSR